MNDDINYIIRGTIISDNDDHIVFQTRNQDISLDDSEIADDEEYLSNQALKLRNVLVHSISKQYKSDLLNKVQQQGSSSKIDKHNMILLTINKSDIIKSIDIEESIFSVDTPLSADYTESRFGIFEFESGDHGRIIDGSKSWSE